MQVHIAVILVLVQIALANIDSSTTNLTVHANLVETKKVRNGTDKPEVISLTNLTSLNTNNTRRKGCFKKSKKKVYKERSTSSSSGQKEIESSGSDQKESLDVSGSSSESDSSVRRRPPFPNATGWRKWHRQCTPCLDDMAKKWRDPSISWICGAYQRARRSFKSECMMYFRNCQDGTMFTKIHEHRCSDNDIGIKRGKHFFYDYKVKISGDSSSKSSEDSLESDSTEVDSDLHFRQGTHGSKEAARQREKKKDKTSIPSSIKKASKNKGTKNETKR